MIYTNSDGGARGNPGPGAIGVIIRNEGNIIEKHSSFIGENVTNNIAEYEGLIKALELAEKAFPNAVFMLMPDAEWYMHDVDKLLELCEYEAHKTGDDAPHSYLVNIHSPTLDFYTQRLLRCSAHIRFVGVVHESPPVGSPYKLPRNIYFELSPSRYGHQKSQKRWVRDRDLLLKHHLEYECRRSSTIFETIHIL